LKEDDGIIDVSNFCVPRPRPELVEEEPSTDQQAAQQQRW
jgi:hypothetical protein